MKRRNRWLVRYIAAFLALVLRLWLSTLRVRVASFDGLMHPCDPTHWRVIYAFWHEGLLAALATRPKAKVLVSKHTDGEVIAQICMKLGVGVIRGSTGRGGGGALLEMIRAESDAHLAITPDGPRGPHRELKPGAVMAASQCGLPLVLIGIGFTRAWRVTSWDRFAIPLPFSTVVGVVGEPLMVPARLDRPSMQHWCDRTQDQLSRLTDEAERWAQRLRRDGRCATPPTIPSLPALRHSA